jgi:hypothetical protein
VFSFLFLESIRIQNIIANLKNFTRIASARKLRNRGHTALTCRLEKDQGFVLVSDISGNSEIL